MKNAIQEVSGGSIVEAARALFRELLSKGLVDALLVPRDLPSKSNVVQSLVTKAEELDTVNPFAPVLPVTTARIVSSMTKVSPSHSRLGVVVRSCELRALTELVKLKQASLENIVLIGVDCFGTMSVCDYGTFAKDKTSPTEEFLKGATDGKVDASVREACQACEYPHPLNADITIGLIGVPFDKGLLLVANTPQGETVLDGLELPQGSGMDERVTAINRLVSEKAKKRDELFEQTQQESHGLEKLTSTFAACIGCHNCRDMCPVCYCKECVFDSPTFDFEADKYLGWASKKGGLRMPTDTLLFHLTRLNHMGTSCVGCGLCQEACPNEVPVFRIFRSVGSKLQDVFEYVPGRSLEDELPLTTFKEGELQRIGYD